MNRGAVPGKLGVGRDGARVGMPVVHPYPASDGRRCPASEASTPVAYAVALAAHDVPRAGHPLVRLGTDMYPQAAGMVHRAARSTDRKPAPGATRRERVPLVRSC